MHPVLRQMKCMTERGNAPASTEISESDGIARLPCAVDQHPRVQLKKDSSEAYVPRRNVFRDNEGTEQEEMRDVKYRSGSCLDVDRHRQLSDRDFEHEGASGVSPARAHMAAADLVTAYRQTVREEANFQTTFNNTVRALVCREEVVMGLLQLWDFVEAYTSNPLSRTLTAQLMLISQHIPADGIFRETLLNIAEPESKWLVDLVNILQSVVVQERTLNTSEKVAAINYSVVTLGKFYARKIYKSPFVPMDKEIKVQTFYMRMSVKVLNLSNDLGVYRNESIERVLSNSRRRELTDEELMFNLRRALMASGDEEREEECEAGGDFEWVPSERAVRLPDDCEEDLNVAPQPYYSPRQNASVSQQPRATRSGPEQAGCGRRVARRV